jgi:hypothetical protein
MNLPDRRKWVREFGINEPVEIRTTRQATILDESPAGLGLLLSNATDLQIGELIEILDRDGVAVTGRIANVQQTPSGEWRVGVQLESYHLPGVYESKTPPGRRR